MSRNQPLLDEVNKAYKKVCGFEDRYAGGVAGLTVQRVKVYNSCAIKRDELVYSGKSGEALLTTGKMVGVLNEAGSVVDYLTQREEAAERAKELAEKTVLNAAPAIVKYPGKLIKILEEFMTEAQVNHFITEAASDTAKDQAQDKAFSALDLSDPVAQNVRDKFDDANQSRLPKFSCII